MLSFDLAQKYMKIQTLKVIEGFDGKAYF